MPATISKSKESSQRRDRFREYMRKVNPTAPARMTIESGLIVEDLHGSLFRTLAARADLEPGSQQLLVGGIGSGKTTELLMAEKWLEGQGQTLCVYIDISSETDLSGLNSGALLAGFGLHLTRAFSSKGFEGSLDSREKKALKAAQTQIKEFAFGKTESTWVPDYDYEPSDDYEDFEDQPGRFITTSVPGKLKPPFPVLQRDIQAIREPLEKFISAVQMRSLDVVVIFDGPERRSTAINDLVPISNSPFSPLLELTREKNLVLEYIPFQSRAVGGRTGGRIGVSQQNERAVGAGLKSWIFLILQRMDFWRTTAQ